AMYYMADLKTSGWNVAAINCSFGSSNTGGLGAACDYLIAQDVMVIVAAGNSNSSSPDYLGSRTDCMDVGATDQSGNPASFSNYGTWVDVAAPGVEVLSTMTDPSDPTTDYIAVMDGTSMSCPHVVGVAALLESYDPTLTAQDKWNLIVNNTKPYNMMKNVGVGIVDVQACLDAIVPQENPPVANFSGAPTSGAYPLTVNFTDLSINSPTSWSWDFGDGIGTSTLQNPSYTYNSTGTYTVTLTATNAYGSDDEVKAGYITVTAPPPPVADFTGSPVAGEYPLTVNFTDLSANNPTSWVWDFGDGLGTSTAQNPSYVYNTVGTYTVSLTATNAYGSDTETKFGYITVSEPGQSDMAYANADIPVLGTVTGDYSFTAVSDNAYEVVTEALSTSHPVKTTSNAEHKWTFEVGTGGSGFMFYSEAFRTDNSEGDNFTFSYSTDNVTFVTMFTVASSAEQIYSASLPNLTGTVYVRVVDANRSWGSNGLDAVYIDRMYFEFETTPQPPTADFVGSPTSGVKPLTVNFTDLSSGSPTSWTWNFGDGTGVSTAQNPSYIYANAGTYTVTLTATNAYGSDIETKVDYITVLDAQPTTMFVQNMVVGRAKVGPNYVGTCTVTIYDSGNLPVSGATVFVTASGATSGSYNGVTGGDGTVSFQTSGVKRPSGEWCFEVTNVTHATYTYDPGSNNVTQACESGWVYGEAEGPLARVDILPTEFGLGQNYPNPFNPTTAIEFNLPQAAYVTLEVYNVTGQKVAVLVDRYMGAGTHATQWDAGSYSSGVYFYRLTAGNYTETKKMVLLK
ncbi:MAG: PKD domain-containing protein, partial [Candidatus Zixiibacteriota bacterium]